MQNSVLSFTAYCAFTLALASIFLTFSDRDFVSVQSNIQNIIHTCNVVNSTPKSFDKYKVTCNNGAVMPIIDKE